MPYYLTLLIMIEHVLLLLFASFKTALRDKIYSTLFINFSYFN